MASVERTIPTARVLFTICAYIAIVFNVSGSASGMSLISQNQTLALQDVLQESQLCDDSHTRNLPKMARIIKQLGGGLKWTIAYNACTNYSSHSPAT